MLRSLLLRITEGVVACAVGLVVLRWSFQRKTAERIKIVGPLDSTGQSLATNQCRANDPSTSRSLQATEQKQNHNDYENGSDYAVRPVAESITSCRESPY
jgi:hypothetical protein